MAILRFTLKESIMPTISRAHLTAIARNKLSAPVMMLVRRGVLLGRILDYGCGRGYDACTLGADKYDPYYSPDRPDGPFATVICNFVLNVIEEEWTRRNVLTDIDDYLTQDGVAYITVRNDRRALKGITSKGTWQGLITLDLPIVHQTTGYTTYAMRKGQSDCAMQAEIC